MTLKVKMAIDVKNTYITIETSGKCLAECLKRIWGIVDDYGPLSGPPNIVYVTVDGDYTEEKKEQGEKIL